MRKKIFAILNIVFILCSANMVAHGAEQIGIIVNNVTLKTDVNPIIENGKTLVPMKSIFEELGATVYWDSKLQQVTAEKDGITILLRIGSKVAYKNGLQIDLEVAPKIVQGRTLVPIRFVSECLGMDVSWNDYARVVFVNDGFKNIRNLESTFNEYVTQIKEGRPSGFGRKYDLTGKMIYEGQFEDGQRDGIGTAYFTLGEKYAGHFENDKIQGTGMLIYPNMSIYVGAFNDGQKSGFGEFRWDNGDLYSGNWQEDMMSGTGIYKFKNGDTYNGSWAQNEMHGQGTYKFKDGRTYSGVWISGVYKGVN